MSGPFKLAILAALALAASHPATADSPFSFSGFGTLGAVHSNQHDADYIAGPFKPDGPGYTRNWSFDVDSRLGAQVIATASPQLSGVVQVIAEQRADDTYNPTLEWANVQYAVTPELSVRAGRIVLPVFLVSQYRKVGYANAWVRPPAELYSLVPITNNDGIDLSYRSHPGEFTNTLQVNYGQADPRLPNDQGSAKIRGLIGVIDTAEYGPLTLHAAYYDAKVTLASLNQLFDAYRQFGPAGAVIADRYEVNDARIRFMSLAAAYEPGDWFLIGEWGKNWRMGFIPERTAWYVSTGYRMDAFTPYVAYAHLHSEQRTDPGLDTTGFPPPQAAAAEQLNAGLNELLTAGAPSQRTLSIGVRWDFIKNAALKVQFDHVDIAPGSLGTFGNIQPDFRAGSDVNLINVNLDFVF